ncbi:Tat proofreading chaperone DmsD [Pantoea sp. B65]|uniref:Tat proofreading chaperone DmsD n=1 Tax=Pantoea sp. B65 TaxID=2813359 RepID=UPI0039B36639
MFVDKQQYLAAVAISGRVLGALFYHAPDSEQVAPLLRMLSEPAWSQTWPLAHPQLMPLSVKLAQGQDRQLMAAWQRLFIGPDALPAPPWGSVWLDRESVLFGDSLLQLRKWMKQHGIHSGLRPGEPEDHIGALLMLAAWLAENGQQQRLDELLAWHLLPWADAFLQLLIARAGHPFYQALGQLTQLTLAAWRAGTRIPVVHKTLYFQPRDAVPLA